VTHECSAHIYVVSRRGEVRRLLGVDMEVATTAEETDEAVLEVVRRFEERLATGDGRCAPPCTGTLETRREIGTGDCMRHPCYARIPLREPLTAARPRSLIGAQ
jgi:hypothetical protein